MSTNGCDGPIAANGCDGPIAANGSDGRIAANGSGAVAGGSLSLREQVRVALLAFGFSEGELPATFERHSLEWDVVCSLGSNLMRPNEL